MRSQRHGKSTSEVEVTNISNHGIWLFVKESEYFLPFEEYPWFKKAKVKEIYNLKLLQEHHLYWPDLDVDLELESLEHPNEYPLIFKN